MKRLIILGERGSFVEWGPGSVMAISDPFPGVGEGWTLWAGQHDSVNLGEFASEEQAVAVSALWLQAIIAAPDGGLLRWDDERQAVVDELAEGDAFAEEPIPAPDPSQWSAEEMMGRAA